MCLSTDKNKISPGIFAPEHNRRSVTAMKTAYRSNETSQKKTSCVSATNKLTYFVCSLPIKDPKQNFNWNMMLWSNETKTSHTHQKCRQHQKMDT
ncbi:hypothetical protein ANANG_G00248880 [Anguilla anguilla]|uniref:Uncharacterized protein n=1 Tax=Anguilla anguilla TaxID=7936 RepID=A0A9D3M054_ANGAN|nr:hypothetical protein ANANG_G00248880 [Anguilla anguilla]